MKVGILTFHCAYNFGAAFQAYALQMVLEQLGHTVYIIDYVPEYLLKDYKIWGIENFNSHSLVESIKLIGHEVLSIPIKIKRHIYFKQFQNNRFRLIPFDNHLSGLDAVVFGSDQIWNINITNGIDPVFWGDNPLFRGKRLVSYAASSGHASVLKPRIGDIEKLASIFYALGVREQDLYELISKVTDNVYLTVDPVILAGEELFRKIAIREKKTKPFLLLFQLGHDSEARRVAERIAKVKGLDILEVLSVTVSFKRNGIINAISPERLIGLFEQCNFVVTSSFHGTVLSLIYHKEFVYVQSDENSAQRVKHLLATLVLSDRHLSNSESILPWEPINYEAVDRAMVRMRTNSVIFLKEMLS